jgi:hypothetical protein
MALQVENARKVETEDSPGIATLIKGIIHDGQELIGQQLQMFLAEFKSDMRQTKEASLPLLMGAGICHGACFLLAIMVALLLNATWPNAIPLWGGFAIVGGLLLIVGVVLFFLGKSRFEKFNPLPDKSVEALKENLQWNTNQKTS